LPLIRCCVVPRLFYYLPLRYCYFNALRPRCAARVPDSACRIARVVTLNTHTTPAATYVLIRCSRCDFAVPAIPLPHVAGYTQRCPDYRVLPLRYHIRVVPAFVRYVTDYDHRRFVLRYYRAFPVMIRVIRFLDFVITSTLFCSAPLYPVYRVTRYLLLLRFLPLPHTLITRCCYLPRSTLNSLFITMRSGLRYDCGLYHYYGITPVSRSHVY